MLGLTLSLMGGTILSGSSLASSLDLDFLTGTLDSRISFSRASAATYTDSTGTLRTAGYNLLTYSSEFDNAAWSKGFTTVTANYSTGPTGLLDADRLVPNGVSGQFFELQQNAPVTSGLTYTFSIYAKSSGYRYVQIIGSGAAFGTFAINFDLDTGAETQFIAGTSTVVGRGIQSVGNGWYRLYASVVALSTASSRMVLDIVPASNSVRGVTWTPSGSDGVLLWGAMLETGTLSDYAPTTTAAASTPRFDHAITTPTVNYLTYSSAFSGASWFANGTTVQADTVAAPDGTLSADTVASTATNAVHDRYQPFTFTAGTYITSVYAKAGTQSWIYVASWDGTTVVGGWFDLTNGAVGAASGGATLSISSAGNGWYRCAARGALAAGAGNAFVGVCPSNNVRSYAATAADTVHVWGMQLEQSTGTAPGTYVPTSGIPARIGGSTTNLLPQSNSFGTAPWTVNALSLSASAGTGPDGSVSAWKLIEAASSIEHFLEQPVAVTAQSYVMSVYAKAAERTRIVLRVGSFGTAGPQQAAFTLTGAGSASVLAGTPAVSITALPNGWYRCAAVFTATSAQTSVFRVHPYDGVQLPYAGDGTSGVLIQGAQLETGSSLGPYVPTTSAAATVNTTEARGLLIEEARTNSLRNNSMIGFVAGTPGTAPTNWNVSHSTVASGIVRELVGSGTENGIPYIDIRFSGTATAIVNPFVLFESTTGIAALDAQTWTGSVYLRQIAGSLGAATIARQVVFYDASQASVGTTSTATVPTAAVLATQRFTVTGTAANATTAWVRLALVFNIPNGTVFDYTFRVGAPQMELGAFATSLIITTGTTATRAADVATIGTLTPWFNAAEGTLMAEFDVAKVARPDITSQYPVALDDGTASNMIAIYTDAVPNMMGFVVTAGVTQAQIGYTAGLANGAIIKAAVAYKANDIAFSANGLTGVADASATIPAVTKLNLGNRGDGVRQLTGHIRRVRYWPARRPNAELQSMTAV